tara:strand:- start:1977 stop:2960 length:984 start_codon:yes stop_codon:yes gene_type:complete
MQHLLEVQDLRIKFNSRGGSFAAVDGLSYHLDAGETLGIVGESGCGKSISALAVLRLIPDPPGFYDGGTIHFQGEDLLELSELEMQQIRGKQISMIFQEPMTSLNPVLTIGRQLTETLLLHESVTKEEAYGRTIDMLRLVQIPEPERRFDEYPYQLSGGMRQRVMIAMALSCNPKVLLADEPTTALDVTIQAQILDLVSELQTKLGTAVILITHDMGVIAENTDRVIVMYAGKKVEEAEVNSLFASPQHPYTEGLLASIPTLDGTDSENRRELNEIKGIVPSLADVGSGCAFAPRCRLSNDHCFSEAPALEQKQSNHWAACWHSNRL